MRIPRLSAFNVIQFAITVLAILFGLYGFFRSGAPTNRTLENLEACATTPTKTPEKHVVSPQPTAPARTRVRPSEPLVVEVPADSLISGNGRIIGRVKYTNGEAAGDVHVSLMGQNAAAMPPALDYSDIEKYRREYDAYLREFSRYLMGTTTDGAGRFAFSKIAENLKYNITVGDPKIDQQTQVAGAGADLTFTLKQPVMVEGIVSREDKEPLGAFTIYLDLDRGGWGQTVRTERFAAGGDGEFHLQASAGKYFLRVEHAGLFQKESCNVDMSRGNTLVEVVLAKGCTLSGIVSGADGAGIAGVGVYVSFPGRQGQSNPGDGDKGEGRNDPNQPQLPETNESDALGAERKASLKKLEKEAAKLKEVLRAETTDDQRKRAILKEVEARKMMEGRVMNPHGGNFSAITDSSGKYRFDSLPPGACIVFVQLGSVADRREITLVSGENTCNFALDLGCRIKITARDSRGNALSIGSLSLVNDKGQWVPATALPTVNKGEAEFMGIPVGKYNATVTAGTQSLQREIEITGGVYALDVVFEEPGTLKGRVSTASGHLPEEIYARLVSTGAGGGPKGDKINQRMEFHVNTDKDGNYKIENLQPGPYEFVVSLMNDVDDSIYKQGIQIVSGEQTWDVALDERCTLVVTVTLDSGMERDGAYVMLASKQEKNGRVTSRAGNPNEKDQCEFFFLDEGEYYLSAYAEGAAQSYIPITIHKGSNTASISIGPPNCVMITSIGEGTQAETLGLKVGDLITSYNGTSVTTLEALATAVQTTTGQEGISLTVMRNGGALNFIVKGGRLGINGQDYHR